MIPVFHIVAGLALWSQARSQRRLAWAAEGHRPQRRQRHRLRTLMLLILLGLGAALAVPAFAAKVAVEAVKLHGFDPVKLAFVDVRKEQPKTDAKKEAETEA
jgi:hypothetical protein